MLKKLLHNLSRQQKGITGLETAIILIAFVVVASVFAYTVLSAGIFSAEKGKEAVYSGLDQARSSLTFKGSVVAKDTDANGELDQVIFTVGNALDGKAIDLTVKPNNVTVISYTDKLVRTDDITFTAVPLGSADDDSLLEPGEKFEITANVTAFDIGIYHTFTIEVKPPTGSVLAIECTTPASIDPVMILH
jgi:archaeal flagellin FlaB